MHFKWVLQSAVEFTRHTLYFAVKIPRKCDEQRILVTFSLEGGHFLIPHT